MTPASRPNVVYLSTMRTVLNIFDYPLPSLLPLHPEGSKKRAIRFSPILPGTVLASNHVFVPCLYVPEKQRGQGVCPSPMKEN